MFVGYPVECSLVFYSMDQIFSPHEGIFKAVGAAWWFERAWEADKSWVGRYGGRIRGRMARKREATKQRCKQCRAEILATKMTGRKLLW